MGDRQMATKELRIVTNNGWIEKGPAVPHEIIPVDGTPLEVLDKAEELLQQGWKLVSAPLPPNVPIMRGPYRSLVIEKNDRQYDKDGLIAIDKARERYRMERENHNLPEPGEDFGVIDRQMLQRMLRDTMLIEAEKEN
ncbi:GrdX family protein [Cloacibacillus evryensis]|nr:GrdX family protein [Cloacibacillus evryensis]MCQ4762928.1 GrdX family protein [Cloacibacillus evryensis]